MNAPLYNKANYVMQMRGPRVTVTGILSVAIPAYNEQDNLEFVVREAYTELGKLSDQVDVVVVDDCSQDDSPVVLAQLQSEFPNLVVHRHAQNQGVCDSLLKGFLLSKGDYCLFIPGDRQIPASEYKTFLSLAEEGVDVVCSWRRPRHDPPFRLWVSGLYNAIIRTSFGLDLHDIDSAFMLSRRAMNEILPRLTSNSAFMSVEIVLLAQQLGLLVGEVEISHRPRIAGEAKGINLRELQRVPVNFLAMLRWVAQQKKVMAQHSQLHPQVVPVTQHKPHS